MQISDAAQRSAATTGRCTFDARLHQHHPRTCVGRMGRGLSSQLTGQMWVSRRFLRGRVKFLSAAKSRRATRGCGDAFSDTVKVMSACFCGLWTPGGGLLLGILEGGTTALYSYGFEFFAFFTQ